MVDRLHTTTAPKVGAFDRTMAPPQADALYRDRSTVATDPAGDVPEDMRPDRPRPSRLLAGFAWSVAVSLLCWALILYLVTRLL